MSDGRLKLGVRIPNTGKHPEEPGLSRMARLAEEAGADALWVGDHILMVEGAQSRYPYSAGGEPWWPLDMPWYEALVTCAYLVALTKTCRVGTAVLILPQRNVLELAKSVATIDKLSGGRMMLGVGLGWLAEETEALGYSFSTRATRADEMIHVLRDCWSGRTSGFNGSQLTIPAGLVFSPTPAQPGGPPILVGGVSPAALRRAGMVGDGWLGRGQPTGLDVSAMRTSIAHVKKHRYDSGRAGSPYNVMMVAPPGAERGSLETLISQTAQSGFDEFLFEPRWDDLDDAAAAIRAARSYVDRHTKLPEPSPDAIGNPRR